VKKLLRVAIFVGVCGLGWPKAYANDCYSDGYQLGAMEADGFCQIWERMYHEDVVVFPSHGGAQLCSEQLVWGCKQAMAERTRHNYPLCTWLVRNGWRNAQGESATTAWANWQRGACSFVLP
jgi:hypothetical protein